MTKGEYVVATRDAVVKFCGLLMPLANGGLVPGPGPGFDSFAEEEYARYGTARGLTPRDAALKLVRFWVDALRGVPKGSFRGDGRSAGGGHRIKRKGDPDAG